VGDTAEEQGLVGLWLRNPIFAAAGREACEELARRFPAQTHPAATLLVTEGSPPCLLVLLSGVARVLHRTADGRDATVRLARAPMIFGDAPLLHRAPFLEDVAAVDEVQVATLPPEVCEELLAAHPAAARQHLLHLAAAACVSARNELQVFASVEQRMANLIMAYADLFGQRRGDAIVIERQLSHQQLAGSVGAARRTVALVLSSWQRAGTLGRHGASLVLLQPERLEELAAPLAGSLVYRLGMRVDRIYQPDQLPAAELEIVSGPARLRGTVLRFEGELLVGRHEPCQLRLPDELVSETHCRVFRGSTGRRFWVQDLDSLNGTMLNGKPVRRAVLCADDLLQVGGTTLRFHFVRRPPSSELAPARPAGETGEWSAPAAAPSSSSEVA